MERCKKKWVDNLSQVVSVRIDDYVTKVEDKNLIRPLNWHARTGHILKHSNPAQQNIDKLFDMAKQAHMVVNKAKTKVMIFNRAKNTDCEPFLQTQDNEIIQYTTKTTLLGVVINDKLTTWDNTLYIEGRAFKRILILKRLANFGCKVEELVTVYIRIVRSVCEFAVQFWGPMLTKVEVRRLERVQRTALHVILGDSFNNYRQALEVTGLESLEERRVGLIKKFALKTAGNQKFAHWFAKNDEPVRNSRNKQSKWKQVYVRTNKFQKSALPVMTEILNQYQKEDTGDICCNMCNQCFTSWDNLQVHKKNQTQYSSTIT